MNYYLGQGRLVNQRLQNNDSIKIMPTVIAEMPHLHINGFVGFGVTVAKQQFHGF